MYGVDNDEDGCWDNHFESLEDAIAFGRAEYGGESFYVGRIVSPPSPDQYIDFDDWLSNVAAQDEYSGDYCDGWFDDVLRHATELTDALRKTVGDWIEKHKLQPKFFLVEGIEYVQGDGTDDGDETKHDV